MKAIVFVWALASFALASAVGRAADGPAPDLFSVPPAGVPAAAPAPAGATVARQRAVAVNFTALESAAPGAALRLNLFDNTAFTGRVERARLDQTGMTSLSGRLADDPLGEFALVRNGDALVGVVRSPTNAALYQISGSPGGGTVVRQVVESAFGACGNGPGPGPAAPAPVSPGPPPGPGGSGQDASCGDDGPLAVVVFYTDVARQAAGGVAAMEAEVQLAVDTTNQVYINSAIGLGMRLAHMEEIAYNENGTFDDHLTRLTSTTDGIMDGVHAIRNRYGADDVVLIVQDDDAGATCGKAWQMTTLSDAFNEQAFAVVNRGCATTNFSFAHEVGHNLGCDHDRANKASSQIATYAFGWQFEGNTRGKPNGKQWRTVMAYNGSPSSNRTGRFSNPNVSFDGTPTGVAPGQTNEADNALVISNSILTATNWRRDTMWVDFGYTGQQMGCANLPFSTLGLATLAVPWTGTVILRPGSSPAEHFTVSKPMTITTSGGVAIIGG